MAGDERCLEDQVVTLDTGALMSQTQLVAVRQVGVVLPMAGNLRVALYWLIVDGRSREITDLYESGRLGINVPSIHGPREVTEPLSHPGTHDTGISDLLSSQPSNESFKGRKSEYTNPILLRVPQTPLGAITSRSPSAHPI